MLFWYKVFSECWSFKLNVSESVVCDTCARIVPHEWLLNIWFHFFFSPFRLFVLNMPLYGRPYFSFLLIQRVSCVRVIGWVCISTWTYYPAPSTTQKKKLYSSCIKSITVVFSDRSYDNMHSFSFLLLHVIPSNAPPLRVHCCLRLFCFFINSIRPCMKYVWGLKDHTWDVEGTYWRGKVRDGVAAKLARNTNQGCFYFHVFSLSLSQISTPYVCFSVCRVTHQRVLFHPDFLFLSFPVSKVFTVMMVVVVHFTRNAIGGNQNTITLSADNLDCTTVPRGTVDREITPKHATSTAIRWWFYGPSRRHHRRSLVVPAAAAATLVYEFPGKRWTLLRHCGVGTHTH